MDLLINSYSRALLDDMTAIIRSSNGSSTWRYLVTYKETSTNIDIDRSQVRSLSDFVLVRGVATACFLNIFRTFDNEIYSIF